MTANPLKYPQGRFKDKPCKRCKTMFSPNAPSHMYCSQTCANDGLDTAYLLREYGITKDDYDRMYQAQDGKCAICKGEGFTMAQHHKVKLVVDHCHVGGQVRGLLCHNCNRALGLLQDNKASVAAALAYLEAN